MKTVNDIVYEDQTSESLIDELESLRTSIVNRRIIIKHSGMIAIKGFLCENNSHGWMLEAVRGDGYGEPVYPHMIETLGWDDCGVNRQLYPKLFE